MLLVKIVDCVPDLLVFVREFRKERKERKKERRKERRGRRLLICYLFCEMCLWTLTLFGLGGGGWRQNVPLRVFVKNLKNGLADLHETL